jgi:hypothetical protein
MKSILIKIKNIISSKYVYVFITSLLSIILSIIVCVNLTVDILPKIIIIWTIFIIWTSINIIKYDIFIGNLLPTMIITTSICFYTLGIIGSLVLNHGDVNKIKVEEYTPLTITHTNKKIILIGNTQILESRFIDDFIKINPKICKQENINMWNIRISDNWYICGK